MFDFLRNLRKSTEEKRQEQLHAYLDNALTPRKQQQLEQEVAQDAALKAQIDDLRLMKQQLRDLPRRPVPRSFTLDPAVYGRPARQPLFQFYPVLQGATVLTALFFVLALSLTLFQPQRASESAAAVPQAALSEQEVTEAEAPAPDLFAADSANEAAGAEAVEVTRVVTESTVETVVEELAAESAAADAAATEAPAMEETSSESGAVANATTDETAQPSAIAPLVSAEQTTTPIATLSASEATIVPTPTVSILPRSSATPTADTRSLDTQATEGQTTTDTIANFAIEEQSPPTPTTTNAPATNPLSLVQIGLGLLLLIFGALTYYVRRNS